MRRLWEESHSHLEVVYNYVTMHSGSQSFLAICLLYDFMEVAGTS